jgi:hypothetical protein
MQITVKLKEAFNRNRMRYTVFIAVSAFIIIAVVIILYVKFSARVYAVGDRGPGGGWVFYDKGDYSDGWRYLEAGPEDLCLSIKWNNGKRILTDAKEKGPGSGKSNTEKIIKKQGNGRYAAKLCDDYSYNMRSDWYLPSIEELKLMYQNIFNKGSGDFSSLVYWSSTEYDSQVVYTWYFKENQTYEGRNTKKFGPYAVRPVRSF